MTKQSINKFSSYPTRWIDGTAVVLMSINCTMWLPNSIQISEYTLVAGSNPTNQKQDRNKQPLWDVPLPWHQWQDAGLSSLISLFFSGDFLRVMSRQEAWNRAHSLGTQKLNESVCHELWLWSVWPQDSDKFRVKDFPFINNTWLILFRQFSHQSKKKKVTLREKKNERLCKILRN